MSPPICARACTSHASLIAVADVGSQTSFALAFRVSPPTFRAPIANAISFEIGSLSFFARQFGIPRSAAVCGSATNLLETVATSPSRVVFAMKMPSQIGTSSRTCSQIIVRTALCRAVKSRFSRARSNASGPWPNRAACSCTNAFTAPCPSWAFARPRRTPVRDITCLGAPVTSSKSTVTPGTPSFNRSAPVRRSGDGFPFWRLSKLGNSWCVGCSWPNALSPIAALNTISQNGWGLRACNCWHNTQSGRKAKSKSPQEVPTIGPANNFLHSGERGVTCP